MPRLRPFYAACIPVIALMALAAVPFLMGAAAGDAQPQKTAAIDLVITADLWQTFYPTGPTNAGQADSLRATLAKINQAKGDKLFLDLGGFSGLTMLTETDYNAGALGLFRDNKFDAINLGQQESALTAYELGLILTRGADAGLTGFVSAFHQTETGYQPQWTPYVAVTKAGMPFHIGGISRDVQDTLFLKAEPPFTGIDHAAYARELLSAAKEKNAFPILLADADDATIDAIARNVEGLPLIVSSSPAAKDITRTVGSTLIIGRAAPNAVTRITLEAALPQPAAKVTGHESLSFAKPPSTPAPALWPATLPTAASMPPTALPDIGLPLDNEGWFAMLGLNSDTRDLNLITGGVVKKFPIANTTVHYYNVSEMDDPSSHHRLIYIRHQLPHPYPNLYFLVLTDRKSVIERVYFPFGTIIGARPARLDEWAQGMTGDNAARIERKLATQRLEYFQALIMADVYHALKILEAGAI